MFRHTFSGKNGDVYIKELGKIHEQDQISLLSKWLWEAENKIEALGGFLNCDRAGRTSDGVCLGYAKSKYNDEPCGICKECPQNQFYEE